MCGRIVNKLGEAEYSVFEVNDVRLSYKPARPRFNVAPTTPVPVVREIEGARQIVEMRWGLRPAWANAGKSVPLMHNARAETVATLSSYRGPFKKRRCIVPASGYYEWRVLGKNKQPFYFTRKDGFLMAFAGIWEHNPEAGDTVSIITTTPNREAATVHDRMPVILRRAEWPRWFEPTPLNDEERERMLVPAPNGSIDLWPVDRAVGSVRNDNPGLIEPISSDPPKGEPPVDLFELSE